MAGEMVFSFSFFAVLLAASFIFEDKKYPYLPFLGLAAFIANLLFELSRYRMAKTFIEDVRLNAA